VSYIIDVYQGRLEAGNFGRCALFVAFFQLVAGPIERGGHVLPVVSAGAEVRLCAHCERAAAHGLGTRFKKKVVVADRLALLVNRCSTTRASTRGAAAGAGRAILTLSDLWRLLRLYRHGPGGAARVLGFDFNLNFQQPYQSLQCGILAALAHFAVELVPGLRVHPAGWQSDRPGL
jgi:D-alanyl-lipoteichoic acid acyltransferase DltB (MBOAT superfamily)